MLPLKGTAAERTGNQISLERARAFAFELCLKLAFFLAIGNLFGISNHEDKNEILRVPPCSLPALVERVSAVSRN
jgi:hypothetical protein